MRTLLIFSAILIVCASCSGVQHKPTRPWDSTERVMFVTHQAVRTVDLMQTAHIFSHAAFHEINPILVAGVGAIGPLFVPVYFVAVAVAEYFIVDHIENPVARKVVLGGAIVASSALVYHNNSVGIGLSVPGNR